MKTVDIRFTAKIPDVEYTEDELQEWLYYELKQSCSISIDNPLYEYGVEPEIDSLVVMAN